LVDHEHEFVLGTGEGGPPRHQLHRTTARRIILTRREKKIGLFFDLPFAQR
jgi:hypothetical protein